MEFIRTSDNSFNVKLKETSSKIIFSIDSNNYFSVKIARNDSEDIVLDRPGEYGIEGVHFVMLEGDAETYAGRPTVVSFSDPSYLNSVVLSKKINFSKKIMNKMPSPDIVIAPFSGEKELLSLIKRLQPSFAILLKDFLGLSGDEKILSQLKNDFTSVIEDSKVKIEKKDVLVEDDTVTQIYILN